MFVSVVMPVYNGRAFLREAIGSVLAQTHRDLELVAVDDGPTDDSPAILEELAAADPRLRVIRQPNGGGARARNRALEEARAEWIGNLDHDDIMLPHRIEGQLAFIAAQADVKVSSCRPSPACRRAAPGGPSRAGAPIGPSCGPSPGRAGCASG